jgi:hypothetical protein
MAWIVCPLESVSFVLVVETVITAPVIGIGWTCSCFMMINIMEIAG